MDQAEYDRQYRSKGPLPAEQAAGAKPRITVVNSTPQEQYQREMEMLAEGGADYGGREEWVQVMRRLRRHG
jgi:hypothetical protein